VSAPGRPRAVGPTPPPYPPIAEYAFIGDCHSVALVSRDASIDWCCMPRIDAASTFGRLLDWSKGGSCSIRPTAPRFESGRRYVSDTMVLETTYRSSSGEARLLDCFTTHEGGASHPRQQLLRVLDGVRGRTEFEVRLSPRFDYGDIMPWIRHHGPGLFSAVGGPFALVVSGDVAFELDGLHDLVGHVRIRAGERARLSITAVLPEEIDPNPPDQAGSAELDARLTETEAWWKEWASRVHLPGSDGPGALRSALVLKALTNAPTGAVAAAATTSLPEALGGSRNWDYRFTWIRDSQFTVRSLGQLGCDAEADGFRRFIERTTAGSAASLQILYGVGGERRLTELELDMEGYKGSRPVRIGNAAAEQTQLDVYGELLELTWRWHRRGQSPDDDYWRFLVNLVETASHRWSEPDRGLWEVRGAAQHFVHSKVMCWVAMDRGIRLADECMRRAPLRRWRRVRSEVQDAIEAEGYSEGRGTFVRAFGSRDLDAALLLLPSVEYVPYDDPRMVRTVDAIRDELTEGGLVRRYLSPDGLDDEEGTFVACTFWLAECLAKQGRSEEARNVFDQAMSTGNDLGLFAEQYQPSTGLLLGNFPQGLSHLSHIAAAAALAGTDEAYE
jgi:GH15 family glucan-1,4-alpha-glucosidase